MLSNIPGIDCKMSEFRLDSVFWSILIKFMEKPFHPCAHLLRAPSQLVCYWSQYDKEKKGKIQYTHFKNSSKTIN